MFAADEFNVLLFVAGEITLPLAPALAACGVRAPLLAGRGLGHTGGTLDKLDSIKGFQTLISTKKMEEIIADKDIGCVICGQTGEICPADRLLYATRDITRYLLADLNVLKTFSC